MKGMGDIMKKAQKMKADLDRIQEELATRQVEASSGGGMVTVRVSGGKEVVSIQIDPSVIDPEERDMLQDLIQAAVNEALRKSTEMIQEETSKIMGGLPFPDIF